MVTDMHSLERAARLSLGDFEAAAPSAQPLRRRFRRLTLAASLAALAMVAAAALLLV